VRPPRGANLNTGTQAVLWVSVPLEVRIERAGSRKVYVSARKVKWALEPTKQAEGHKLSAFAFRCPDQSVLGIT